MAGAVETAYCVKCKAKRPMTNPAKKTAKNGRAMLVGTCPVCSTKMVRFVSK